MAELNIDSGLSTALLPWYEQRKRDLPWRADRDPYHIWVSEIMLQQTRVEAVKGYYTRFIEALPTIDALASAEDDALHKLWEGLGYYSRVRNMKKAALLIMEEYNGKFPDNYEDILALPGVGEYTAGAISSIAYDLPTPAVDGNVLRVIARLSDYANPIDIPAFKKSVRSHLSEIYPRRAGDFTQALMELGATVCGPNRKPDCSNCPCADFCLGYKRGSAEYLPVKTPKRVRSIEERTVFILSCDGLYALQKRAPKGLLANLWQFPNVTGKLEIHAAMDAVEGLGLIPREIMRVLERKHIFTHIEWRMSGVYMEVSEINTDFVWMTAEQIEKEAALPTAFRQFWEEIKDV